MWKNLINKKTVLKGLAKCLKSKNYLLESDASEGEESDPDEELWDRFLCFGFFFSFDADRFFLDCFPESDLQRERLHWFSIVELFLR